MKPVLSFYTNVPTPYQLDLFEELKKYYSLQIVYFSDSVSDRYWNLNSFNKEYKITFLKNTGLFRFLNKKFLSFHFSFSIINVLRKDKAQVVIINGAYWSPNGVVALIISKLKGKKVYFWGEPIHPTNNKIKFFLKRIGLLPVRMATNGLMAIGVRAVNSFRHYGYNKPIHNIPYSIDIKEFERANLDSRKLSKTYADCRKQDEIVFLTSGTLSHRKGIDLVITAFKKLSEEFNVRLLIIGEGPLRPELETLAAGNQKINFLGFIEKEDVPYYFSISDIFIFASRYDGWALVINEAIASHLPIISSDNVGAAADLLVNGENAVICKNEATEEYYQAMRKLVTDEAFRLKLKAKSMDNMDRISSAYNAKRIYTICSEAEPVK
jgi:glycosyltransferase involved in cell wall biosynthesis